MGNKIIIRELSKLEINELENIKDNFNELGPVKCCNCGFKGPFIRRLFEIKGMESESDQNIVRIYIKKTRDLEYCIFRSHKSIDYIESATCPECKSQRVIFDISKKLCEEMLRKIKNGDFDR